MIVEAAELAERHHAPLLAACDRRFEVGVDDLYAPLDEINTLIEVQSTLRELVGGYLHLAWNGSLTAPDGTELARA